MSNYLEGIFHPAYSFDTISGFQTILNTSLEGNVTIGNLNTSFGLLLNGVPITSGGGPSTYEWSEHPAVQYVMINGFDISGITSFNNISAVFNSTLNRVGLGNNVLSGSFGSNNNAFGIEAGKFNNGSELNALGHFAGYLNMGSYVNAIGFGSALSNAGSYVNAIGYGAGYSNIGSNCSFLGSNPDFANSNTFDNRFIAYSTNSSNPFLYGDTSNNQLSIGTSNLSANLTISGSLFATGSIYDSTYSTGAPGQVLSSTGSGTQWITGGGGPTTLLITTSQNINFASNVMLQIKAVGGGAGGNYGVYNINLAASSGGGGGGSGYEIEKTLYISANTNLSFEVGNGGSGGIISTFPGVPDTPPSDGLPSKIISSATSVLLYVSGGYISANSNGGDGYYGGGGGFSGQGNPTPISSVGGNGLIPEYNGQGSDGSIGNGGNGGGVLTSNGGQARNNYGGGGGGGGQYGGRGAYGYDPLTTFAATDGSLGGGGGGGCYDQFDGGNGGNGYFSVTIIPV